MILRFAHRGLEAFFRSGSKAGIQPKHERRLRLQLSALDIAVRPEDMDAPGWSLYVLKGELRGHYAVEVNGNWRLIFRFQGQDVVDVDYVDYH